MATIDNLINSLDYIKINRDGSILTRCPSHSDRSPSLSIKEVEDDDGYKILMHCFAGCSKDDILNDFDIKMSDLFNKESYFGDMTGIKAKKEKIPEYDSIEDIVSTFKEIESIHEYYELDSDKCSLLQIRYPIDDRKSFATYHYSDGKWLGCRPDELMPLYNINNVKDSKAVLIVEGEKVVDKLSDYGIPAVCSLGGSNSPESTDWTTLKDKSSVAMWRDNDTPGLKYQNKVRSILDNLFVPLKCVRVEDLELNESDDLVDYINNLVGSKEDIVKDIYSKIPKEAEGQNPVELLENYLIKVRTGEIRNIEVPYFPQLTDGVRMFKPGSQSVLYSAGGVGKTLFMGRTCDDWTLTGVARVKRLMLESPMSFHLLRSLAQQSGTCDVTKEEFHKSDPIKSERLVTKYSDVLRELGHTITTSDTGAKTSINEWNCKTVIKWIEKHAPNNDVLVIDPVSIIISTREPWVDSTYLAKSAEEIMIKYPHLSIVWIHHPNSEGYIAGGQAWSKYTSAIVEMVAVKEPQMHEVKLQDGITEVRLTPRYMNIKKCRNGSMLNESICIDFDVPSLTFKEVGVMGKKVKP